MSRRTIEIIGWAGVAAIVLAFALSVFALVTFRSPLYLWLNFLGALAVMFEAYHKKDYQPAVLNAIWTLIAAVGIIRGFLT